MSAAKKSTVLGSLEGQARKYCYGQQDFFSWGFGGLPPKCRRHSFVCACGAWGQAPNSRSAGLFAPGAAASSRQS